MNPTYYDTLSSNAKSLVSTSNYYLGGVNSSVKKGNDFYTAERSNSVNDEIATNYVMNVGLMYPSDYIYIYALGVGDDCFNRFEYGVSNSSVNKTNNWMYLSNDNKNIWLISPVSTSSIYSSILNSSNIIGYNVDTDWSYAIKPTLYLKPEVKIKSGDGTIDNPYEFEL